MSTELVKVENNSIQTSDIEQVLIGGDLSKLNQEQRMRYVQKLCQDTGLNILSRPFDYMNLQGKLVLYANKGCAEQLRAVNKISVSVTSREQVGDLFVVTARAKKPDGREDESTGAVNVSGMKGEMLANAMMKAETKAKRRVTLSICGLNMLDETEVASIPGAKSESTLNEKYGLKQVEQTKTEIKQAEVCPPEEPKAGDFGGPEVQEQPLDEFVIRVKGSHQGKKFKDVGKEELEKFATSSFKWFNENKITISPTWQEFFQKAELYCFGPNTAA